MSLFARTPIPASCNAALGGSRFSKDQFPVVYVVGDIHGDYEAFKACMLMTGCVRDLEGKGFAWKPEATRVAVVVLGDVVDRWRNRGVLSKEFITDGEDGLRSMGEVEHEEFSILYALNALATQAEAAKSAVFRLVGNHELMQMVDEATCFAQTEFATPFAMGIQTGDPEDVIVGKRKARQHDFSSQQGTMHASVAACHVKAIVQIGSTIFVHGGINDGLVRYAASKGRDLLEMCNTTLTEYLNTSIVTDDYNTLLMNAGKDRGGDAESPGILWDDDLSNGGMLSTCGLYGATVLAMLNASVPHEAPAHHIAVAHCQQSFTPFRAGCVIGQVPAGVSGGALYDGQTTVGVMPRFMQPPPVHIGNDENAPYMQGVNTIRDGLVWRMDVAMSRAFRRTPAFAVAGMPPFCRPAILRIDESGNTVEFEVRKWKHDL